MAQGDVKWFAQGLHDLGNKIHDMDGDDWRIGLVTSAVTPAGSPVVVRRPAGRPG